MDFDSELAEAFMTALEGSEYWNEKTNTSADYINNLTWPECEEDRAWAHAAAPFVIFCNRLNNCGAQTKALTLFPELGIKFEDRFAPTSTDPQRPATEYLKSRGLSKALEGLEYEYWSYTREGCGGAAMFPIDGGNNE